MRSGSPTPASRPPRQGRLRGARRAALGPQTDAAYVALAHRLHAGGAGLALATHDAALRDALLADLPGARCELLLGVRPADALALAAAGRDVRVYVPFGEQWFRYFMRRRAEAQGA